MGIKTPRIKKIRCKHKHQNQIQNSSARRKYPCEKIQNRRKRVKKPNQNVPRNKNGQFQTLDIKQTTINLHKKSSMNLECNKTSQNYIHI